jgi:hypothetical protein
LEIQVANPFKEFTVHVGRGETVYHEGEPGTMMYVIQSGAVELFRQVGQERVSYGLLEKGDFFGEMSLLLESQARTTSAQVIEDADLVEINSTLFDKMIRGNIEIAVRMMRKLSLRLREYEERMREARAAAHPAEPPAPAPRPAPVPPSRPAARPRPAAAAPAGRPPGAFAAFVTEDGTTEFPLAAEGAAIGRFDPVTGMRPEVDLSAVDINRSVSRHHARVSRSRGEFSLTEEVGALNGTFVNGKRLTTGKPAPLRDGDEVGLGMVRLRFRVLEKP